MTKDHEFLSNLLAILFSLSTSIYTFGTQQEQEREQQQQQQPVSNNTNLYPSNRLNGADSYEV